MKYKVPTLFPPLLAAVLVALASVAVGASPAHATTYYVSTGGQDTNPGTQASPWRTIAKAAATMVAGDTAIVAGGTYAERVTATKSGTATAPIKFVAASGQTPIIDGAAVSTGQYGALFAFSNVSYVKLDGFTIKNSQGYGVMLAGNTTRVEAANLDVSNCASAGAIWVEGATSPSYSTIRNNNVHDNPHGGIVLWNSPGGYYLVERNRVWNNAGGGNFDGIQVGGEAAGLHHVVGTTSRTQRHRRQGADQIDMGGHSAVHHYCWRARSGRRRTDQDSRKPSPIHNRPVQSRDGVRLQRVRSPEQSSHLQQHRLQCRALGAPVLRLRGFGRGIELRRHGDPQ
jgi:parallel beta-helix repeat protein